MFELVDFRTREKVVANNMIFTGPAGPWEVVMDLDRVRSRINPSYFKSAPPVVSKYLPFMPIGDYSAFVTLGEGSTPLIRSDRIGKEFGAEVYFKLESQNPTGAFKDRGSAVEISIAKELGAPAVVVASTGNMAASISCYAAAAHIPCFVFVPEDTPPSKLAQVISYGGRIVQIKGSYGDAAMLAYQVAEELGFYLCGDYAFRVEGHKTAAFEVVEQLFFNPPDFVVVPVGCGTNIASYYKGFRDYRELGFIDQIPSLVGVQAEGAPTVVAAFEQGLNEGITFGQVNSIARAISINHPLDGAKALDAIYRTNGLAIALSDTEILQAQYRLSREEGLFVEAACATTVASLNKLAERRSLEGKRIVCVLTGSGLKDPTTVLKIAIKPPTIYPDPMEFLSLYRGKFFEGKNVTFVDHKLVIFSEEPSLAEIKEQLNLLFEISYSEEHLGKILEVCRKFLKKGKTISFSDFQDIVQDSLESFAKTPTEFFSVLDFNVQAGRDRKSQAQVLVSVAGTEIKASGEGAGPVDAIINALRSACGEKMRFALSSYKVNIRSEGTDAVVYVELKLAGEKGVSVGTGASPDIIQASIEAFEEAYNGLYHS